MLTTSEKMQIARNTADRVLKDAISPGSDHILREALAMILGEYLFKPNLQYATKKELIDELERRKGNG